MSHFQVAVIGSGPGGYVAAIRAAQLGFSVITIDHFKNEDGKPSLGGACLNVGCVPSKALLESSEQVAKIQHQFPDHGIDVSGVSVNISRMQQRKKQIVEKLTQGIRLLLQKNKIIALYGTAQIIARENEHWQIQVGKEIITAEHVIIATGSSPRPLPHAAFDHHLILDNADILSLTEVPQRLGIIGAGVIGLEMGSVWHRLGSNITILEALPEVLPNADIMVAREVKKHFARQNLPILTHVKIKEIIMGKEQVTVRFRQGENEQEAVFDKLMVAIGRIPNSQQVVAPSLGLELDERGFIAVDGNCRTNLPNIWAIGDVVRGPMLAHKASEEGVAVAERIAGQQPYVDFNTVPWVIYTSPEIAWVGQTEQQLQAAGVEYKKGQNFFAGNARAQAMAAADGMIKVLADKQTDQILGVHIVGPYASELIAEAVVAMEFKASSEDIGRTMHPHPSLSEAFHEAALACDKRSIHG